MRQYAKVWGCVLTVPDIKWFSYNDEAGTVALQKNHQRTFGDKFVGVSMLPGRRDKGRGVECVILDEFAADKRM